MKCKQNHILNLCDGGITYTGSNWKWKKIIKELISTYIFETILFFSSSKITNAEFQSD